MSRCRVGIRKTIVRVRLKKMHRRLEKERQQGTAMDVRQDTTQRRRQLTSEEAELDREIASDFYGI